MATQVRGLYRFRINNSKHSLICDLNIVELYKLLNDCKDTYKDIEKMEKTIKNYHVEKEKLNNEVNSLSDELGNNSEEDNMDLSNDDSDTGSVSSVGSNYCNKMNYYLEKQAELDDLNDNLEKLDERLSSIKARTFLLNEEISKYKMKLYLKIKSKSKPNLKSKLKPKPKHVNPSNALSCQLQEVRMLHQKKEELFNWGSSNVEIDKLKRSAAIINRFFEKLYNTDGYTNIVEISGEYEDQIKIINKYIKKRHWILMMKEIKNISTEIIEYTSMTPKRQYFTKRYEFDLCSTIDERKKNVDLDNHVMENYLNMYLNSINETPKLENLLIYINGKYSKIQSNISLDLQRQLINYNQKLFSIGERIMLLKYLYEKKDFYGLKTKINWNTKSKNPISLLEYIKNNFNKLEEEFINLMIILKKSNLYNSQKQEKEINIENIDIEEQEIIFQQIKDTCINI